MPLGVSGGPQSALVTAMTRSNLNRFVLFAAFSLLAAFGSGCTLAATMPNMSIEARPMVVAQPQVVYVEAPPRVYYGGQWLHYRSNAYYYSNGGAWHVASSVPTHVVRYHRPTYVSPGPVHVQRTVSPSYTYRSGPRPVHVSPSPVHVRRTVTPHRPVRR